MIKNLSNEKRKNFLWKNASLPAFFAICAFICFLIVYWLMTVQKIEPFYFLGLIFILPSLTLGLIAWLAGRGKLNRGISIILTAILVPIFMISSLFGVFIIAFLDTSATVTNATRYERTLKLANYTEKDHLVIFPKKIPKNANNTYFYYNMSAWQEYSETVVLRFSTDKETIKVFEGQFKKQAIEIDNKDYKTVFDKVSNLYIKDLTGEYVMYLIIYEPGYNNKDCAVFINQEKNEIIFYAFEMRW